MNNITSFIAHLHTFCISIIVLFHFLLIFGKPWGHLTMAGKYQGELPNKMKLVSAISIIILCLIALMVEIGARNIFQGARDIGQITILVAILFNLIQVILHIITPSKWERILWLPILMIMLICSSIVYWSLYS